MEINIERAKAYSETRRVAVDTIIKCYHPKCNEPAINSHILQKEKILCEIAPDRHHMKRIINKFYTPDIKFEKRGIDKAFSFNCFCKDHDENLFLEIEKNEIDFNNYKHYLLLVLRGLYREINIKEINVRQNELLIDKYAHLIDISDLQTSNNYERLGLNDLKKTEELIWNDLQFGSQSFEFGKKEMTKEGVVLSSIFTYETSKELNTHRARYGVEAKEITDIFVTFFPHGKNSVFIMGYKKTNASKVKGYVNMFMKENERKTKRRLSNLLLFNCEVWVCSEKFYKEKIEKNKEIFFETLEYTKTTDNERKTFDLNIFENNFNQKLIEWHKIYQRTS